ncbi:hypothetical protein JA9_004746 [Meyerozyma sp. JA9]|nr:hypothetical protein JA9_004746 [Meyerozyma sp. JA9]
MAPPKKTMDEVDLPTNPYLPAWILTPKEEKAIFEKWRKKAFAKCDDLIRAYIDCSNSYQSPFEAMSKCEKANQASMGCVEKYQQKKYLDIERNILIKEKMERQRQWKESQKSQAN